MGPVVRVDVLEPPIPEFLFHRAPGEIEPCVIEKSGMTVRTGCDDHHGGRVRKASEMSLALPQGGFDALAIPQGPSEPQRNAQCEGQPRSGPSHPLKASFFLDPFI